MYVYVSSRCLRPAARIPLRPVLRSALIPLAIGFLAAATPAVSQGQSAGPLSDRSSLGVAAGVFKYEPSDDNGSPIFAVRLDRPMSRWARFEIGTSYTRPEIQADAEGFFDPTLPAEYTNLFAVTAGIQARLTVGFRLDSSAGTKGVPRAGPLGVRRCSSPSASVFGPPITSVCGESTASTKTVTRYSRTPIAR
jgi:hypothetical protein